MATETPCQTPGAQFHTTITATEIGCSVTLPFELQLSTDQAKLLEANLHNAFELVLARYFDQK